MIIFRRFIRCQHRGKTRVISETHQIKRARVCNSGITLPLPLPLLLDYLTDEICGVKRKRTTHFRHLLCTAGTPNPPRRPPNPRAFANHHNPGCQTNNTCFLPHTLRLTTPHHHHPQPHHHAESRHHTPLIHYSPHHTTSHRIAPHKWPTWTSTSRAATRSRACSPTASGTSWTSLSTQSTTPRGKQSSPSSPPCCYLCLSAR